MKITVFWDATIIILIDKFQPFGRTYSYCFHCQGRLQGVKSLKTAIFTTTAVKTQNFHKLKGHVFAAQYHAIARSCEVGENQHGVSAPGERCQH